MQRLSVSSTTKVRFVLLRRSFSSTNNKTPAAANVGTIKRRTKPAGPGRATPGSPEAEKEMSASSVSQEVSGEVFRNNMLLGAACLAFAGGVMWYSMHAVGQSGSSADDPLAALKEEASEAQAARDKESRQSDEASSMLKQFQRGGFDPDQVEEDDEDIKTDKKPWWKFW